MTGLSIGLLLLPTSLLARGFQGIYVLSAIYGKHVTSRPENVTDRVQDLCGHDGGSCSLWCAQSTFGGHDVGRHGLCRAIYRCPDGSTRAAEATRDEALTLRCTAEADERTAAARAD